MQKISKVLLPSTDQVMLIEVEIAQRSHYKCSHGFIQIFKIRVLMQSHCCDASEGQQTQQVNDKERSHKFSHIVDHHQNRSKIIPKPQKNDATKPEHSCECRHQKVNVEDTVDYVEQHVSYEFNCLFFVLLRAENLNSQFIGFILINHPPEKKNKHENGQVEVVSHGEIEFAFCQFCEN